MQLHKACGRFVGMLFVWLHTLHQDSRMQQKLHIIARHQHNTDDFYNLPGQLAITYMPALVNTN